MSFAYVQFVVDKTRQVVPTGYIRKFREDYEKNHRYKVLYKNDAEDQGGYYRAYIISLGATELEARTKGEARRFRIPNASVEGDDEETSQDDVEQDKENSSTSNSQQNKKKMKGVKSGIQNQFQYKELMTELFPDKLASETYCTSCTQLQKENKDLNDLNFKLQSNIFDDWKELSGQIKQLMVERTCTPAAAGLDVVPVPEAQKDVGFRHGGRIHLGRDVWIDGVSYDSVCFRSKNVSVFIKNVASIIFGDDVLAASSVTGLPCNRTKSTPRQKLDPTKLMALKDIVRFKMRDDGQSPQNIEKTMSRINQMISQKILDLNRIRPKKVVQRVIDLDEEVELSEQLLAST